MTAGEFTVRAEDRAEVRAIVEAALKPVQEAVRELGNRLQETLKVMGDQQAKHAALEATVAAKIPEAEREHQALHARIGRGEALTRSLGLLFAGALITLGVAALVKRPEPPPAPGLEQRLDAIQNQLARTQQLLQQQAPTQAPVK